MFMSALAGMAGETDRKDIPEIHPEAVTVDGESAVRGGMPHLFDKIASGDTVTVAFLGGSITQGGFCYRLQLEKYLEQKYQSAPFKWVNAGVSGTGTELGVFRLDEQVMSARPDAVFVEFTCNGGYAPALEGIIRKIKTASPETDICLLYSATEPMMRQWQEGIVPDLVAEQERMADHYNLPSVRMALRAAQLEKEGKLIWKGKRGEEGGKILFSGDGLHPAKGGGNLYAEAVARALGACAKVKAPQAAQHLPDPMYGTVWDAAKMYKPADICKEHGLWKDADITANAKLKQFAGWFPTVMTSGHPNSTLSFAFDGDMFGIFDIGGPEMGQLEIYVDGQMVRLKNVKDGNFKYYESTPLTGTHYLNRFNRHCNNRYRGQFDLIKVEPGLHQVTIKLSETKADKAKILGDNNADITENPDKYDQTYLRLGRILVRGEIAECNPVKGLPKMAQQMKWEKKIKDYMERDEEQAALEDATLVVGSSSIELWKSMETDFPGRNVIRRGVSGTKAIDLYNYREQLIAPFNPKRIIIYEGDNEIGYKWEVEEMMASMERLFHEVRRMKPDAEIYLVSVKPSPRRVEALPKVQEFNRRLKAFAESQPRCGYIDIHTPMLDADGNVRGELYLEDRLHPSKEGYAIWISEFGKVINRE